VRLFESYIEPLKEVGIESIAKEISIPLWSDFNLEV
jgi:hypothetical protein